MPVLIGPDLTFADVIAVARHDEPVEVSEQALTAVDRAADHVAQLADDVVPHLSLIHI